MAILKDCCLPARPSGEDVPPRPRSSGWAASRADGGSGGDGVGSKGGLVVVLGEV